MSTTKPFSLPEIEEITTKIESIANERSVIQRVLKTYNELEWEIERKNSSPLNEDTKVLRNYSIGQLIDKELYLLGIEKSLIGERKDLRNSESMRGSVSKQSDKDNRSANKTIALLLHAFQVKPISTSSQRETHQEDFKNSLIREYQCQSCSETSNARNYIRCVATGQYIRHDLVKASHLIALKDDSILKILSFSSTFKWNPKNGLLLFYRINKAFENMEITFLLNPLTSIVTIQVLYDDLLDKEIFLESDFQYFEAYQGLNKRKKQEFRQMNRLTFRDLNGKGLILPPLVFPSKRILAWIALSAYNNVLADTRSHQCALLSHPSPESWEALMKYVNTGSEECTMMTGIFSRFDRDGEASDLGSVGECETEVDTDAQDLAETTQNVSIL